MAISRMSGPVGNVPIGAAIPTLDPDQQRMGGNFGRVFTVSVLAIGALVLTACPSSSGDHTPKPEHSLSVKLGAESCSAQSSLSHETFRDSDNNQQFLPGSKVSAGFTVKDNDTAAKYIQSFFDPTKGVLNGGANANSLSALDAAMHTAVGGKSVDIGYDPRQQFAGDQRGLSGSDAAQLAKKLCQDEAAVLSSAGVYLDGSTNGKDYAIANGQKYIKFQPVVGADGSVVFELNPQTSSDNKPGIAFRVPAGQKLIIGGKEYTEADGFAELVIQPKNGEVDLTGFNQIPNKPTENPTTATSAPTSSSSSTGGGSRPGPKTGPGGPAGPRPGEPTSFGTASGSGESPVGPPVAPETGPGPQPSPTQIVYPSPTYSVPVTPPSTPPEQTTPPEQPTPTPTPTPSAPKSPAPPSNPN